MTWAMTPWIILGIGIIILILRKINKSHPIGKSLKKWTFKKSSATANQPSINTATSNAPVTANENISEASEKTKKGVWERFFDALIAIGIFIALLVFIMFVLSATKACNRMFRKPSHAYIQPKVPSIQKETIYLFSDWPNGKIIKYLDLTHGASWEVIGEVGQKIIIHTPNGTIWSSEHNGPATIRQPMYDGTFIFEMDPKYPGAKGIKLTN